MKYYPLADKVSLSEYQRLGKDFVSSRYVFMGKLAGEFRPPRKGEWYLSGAKPHGYKAPNDLSTPYHILKVVCVEQTTTFREVSK